MLCWFEKVEREETYLQLGLHSAPDISIQKEKYWKLNSQLEKILHYIAFEFDWGE